MSKHHRSGFQFHLAVFPCVLCLVIAVATGQEPSGSTYQGKPASAYGNPSSGDDKATRYDPTPATASTTCPTPTQQTLGGVPSANQIYGANSAPSDLNAYDGTPTIYGGAPNLGNPNPYTVHPYPYGAAPMYGAPSYPSAYGAPAAHFTPAPGTPSYAAPAVVPAPAAVQSSPAPVQKPLVIAASDADIERANQVAQVYELSDLVRAFEEQYEVSTENAQLLLAYELQRPINGAPAVRSPHQMRWNQQRLVILAAPEQHARYESRLTQLRKNSFQELDVAICLATAPSELLAQQGLKWNVDSLPVEVREMEPAAVDTAHASSLRKQPVKWCIIDRETTLKLEQQLSAAPTFQVIGRPKIRLHNGRRASAESASHRAFVVGFDDRGGPEVRNFPVGWQVVVIPELRDGHVVVRGHWNNTEVLGVETVSLADDRSLQIPEILQRQLNWTHQVPLGATLVIAGNRRLNAEGAYEESVALLRVTGRGMVSTGLATSRIPSFDLRTHTQQASHHQPDGLIAKAYLVRSLLPPNAASQEYAFSDLVDRVRMMEMEHLPHRFDISIRGNAEMQWLLVRHTAAGHSRIASLLENIHHSLHTHLQASLLQLPAAGPTPDSKLGAKLQELHSVISSGDLLQLTESYSGSRSALSAESRDGGYVWKLENGDEIIANFVTSAAMKRHGKHIITVQHQRAEHVVAEFDREVQDFSHLLLEVTPPPTLLETTQKLLGLATARSRQFVVITPAKRSGAASAVPVTVPMAVPAAVPSPISPQSPSDAVNQAESASIPFKSTAADETKVADETIATDDEPQFARGQTLPSPYYIQDDVQYFPTAPSLKPSNANADTSGEKGPKEAKQEEQPLSKPAPDKQSSQRIHQLQPQPSLWKWTWRNRVRPAPTETSR